MMPDSRLCSEGDVRATQLGMTQCLRLGIDSLLLVGRLLFLPRMAPGQGVPPREAGGDVVTFRLTCRIRNTVQGTNARLDK